MAVVPTVTVVAEAVTATSVTVTKAATTVRTTVPLWPLNVPVIVVVPPATAVTVPDAVTVATVVLLELQVGEMTALVPSL